MYEYRPRDNTSYKEHDASRFMDPKFRESRPILPRQLATILAATLLATLAFMALMPYLFDAYMPSWMLATTAVLFIIVIAVSFIPRMDLEVYDDSLVITHVFRRIEIPFEDILDKKFGSIYQIRNYGSYNLKGVKHRFYSVVGDDEGVAVRLTEKRVVVVSTQSPQEVHDMIPVRKEE